MLCKWYKHFWFSRWCNLFCFSNHSSYMFVPTKGITSWNNHSQISFLFYHLSGWITHRAVTLRFILTNMQDATLWVITLHFFCHVSAQWDNQCKSDLMVSGDRAFPINFESSANSMVLFVVIAGTSLMNKSKSRGPKNGTLRHSK